MSDVFYSCKKCSERFAIPVADPNMHLLKKIMRCPNACVGKQYRSTDEGKMAGARRISALHFYQACMGVGLPGERRCSPAEVRKMLLGATIKSCELTASPDPKRSIITALSLGDGKTIHFASSSKGATIYKVTDGR